MLIACTIELPNILHYEWAFKALSGGKHVLIEKPIADTEAEAAALVTLAEQKGLVLLEANHWWCVVMWRATKFR